MDDNSKYIAISPYTNTGRHKYDQLIIVDDSRWNIFTKYNELIHNIIKFDMSNLFDDFDCQIQKYEW